MKQEPSPPPPPSEEGVQDLLRVEVIFRRERVDVLLRALVALGVRRIRCREIEGRFLIPNGDPTQPPYVSPPPSQGHRLSKLEIIASSDALGDIRAACQRHLLKPLEILASPVCFHSLPLKESLGQAQMEQRKSIVFECVFDSDGLI